MNFPGTYSGNSRKFREISGKHTDTSGKNPGHFQGISGKFPVLVPDISRKCTGNFQGMSGNRRGISKTCPEIFREMLRTNSGFFPGKISGNPENLSFPRFSYDFLFKRWSRGGSGEDMLRSIQISGPGTSKTRGNRQN